MRREDLWVLGRDDESVIADLALGLGVTPARVLTYLIRRATDDRVPEPKARQIEIRLGTDLGQQAVVDALSKLKRWELVTESTVESDHGRPPKAWTTEHTVETAVRRVYSKRAATLLAEADADISGDTSDGGPLRLGLNWHPNGLHVPFYAARLEDDYRDQRIDVEITHHEGSERALQAVTDGDVDVGVVGAATLTRARQQGCGVVPIAVLYQRAMTVLYTTRDAFGGPLTGTESLEGRRVGLSPSTETRLLAELFLLQAGVTDTIEIVETAGEEAAALLSGDADVVAGSFSDPWELQDDHTVDVLTLSEQFPMYGPALIVDPTADLDGTRIERFLTATLLGWRAGRRDPEPAAREIAHRVNGEPAEIERTFGHAIDTFADSKDRRTHGWGVHEDAEWERMRTMLTQMRRLDGG
ncbi:MAG: ABC transporter substrate-binding protein [Natronomonas sp.]